jgi:hypothetical protein
MFGKKICRKGKDMSNILIHPFEKKNEHPHPSPFPRGTFRSAGARSHVHLGRLFGHFWGI